jgi:hypothetical protein
MMIKQYLAPDGFMVSLQNSINEERIASKGMVTLEAPRLLSIRLGRKAIRVGQALGFELESMHGMPPEKWVAAAAGDPAALEGVVRWSRVRT